uniref:Uncharacterized protein n=1 Tax=Romanomermis culicivorax TaxID=13658 RepID=A0A915I081_ROMCU
MDEDDLLVVHKILIIMKFGDVYGWGWNADNQLALDKYKVTVIDKPNFIQLNEKDDLIVYRIACGTRFSVILTETGDIFVFGYLKNDFCSNMLQMNILEENSWKINYNKDQSKVLDLAASSWNLTLLEAMPSYRPGPSLDPARTKTPGLARPISY